MKTKQLNLKSSIGEIRYLNVRKTQGKKERQKVRKTRDKVFQFERMNER